MLASEVWDNEVLKHVYASELQKLLNTEDNWSWYGIHSSLQVSHRLHSQQGKVNSTREAKRERIIDNPRARWISN